MPHTGDNKMNDNKYDTAQDTINKRLSSSEAYLHNTRELESRREEAHIYMGLASINKSKSLKFQASRDELIEEKLDLCKLLNLHDLPFEEEIESINIRIIEATARIISSQDYA